MSKIAITAIGVSFIFLMTTFGAATVFIFRKKVSDKLNCLFMGFASGLMIAASVWSLLLPSIEQADGYGSLKFLPAACGIVLGCLFLLLMDKIIPKLLVKKNKTENFSKKSFKLFLAVTLHNIPEGLAVGLAFGNAFILGEISVFYSALWLAIGIGVQNLPEGAAISLPMREDLHSNKKAFFFGASSGLVEPIMAVVGIFLSTALSSIMPWLLAFSAGAMLFVVAEELLPDAKTPTSGHIGSWGFIVGFVIMMILDVALS